MSDLAQLDAPFADEELRHFAGRGGKEMTFIEDETVMDRLDAGVGRGNWQIATEPLSLADGVAKVGIGIRWPDSDEWTWYWDYGYPNQQGGDMLKEAVSDGIRRCGRMVGIARDLYRKRTYETTGPQNGHSAPRPVAVPQRSSTAIPDELDVLDWDELSPAPPKAAPRSGGTMWSKDLFERAEAASIDKKQISDTAKKMFGQAHWKVTDLDDGQRFALAVELGIA